MSKHGNGKIKWNDTAKNADRFPAGKYDIILISQRFIATGEAVSIHMVCPLTIGLGNQQTGAQFAMCFSQRLPSLIAEQPSQIILFLFHAANKLFQDLTSIQLRTSGPFTKCIFCRRHCRINIPLCHIGDGIYHCTSGWVQNRDHLSLFG